MNGELPKGWVWTSLGEIAFKLRSGGTPLKKINEYYENGTIPFVKIEDMSTAGKYLYNTLTTITGDGLNNSSAWMVPKNSLLYSMYASYGIPIINKIEVATNQAIIAFIPPKSLIDLDYVYYYLLYVKSSLKTKIRGTTQENLNAKIVSNIEVPLPPLAEQQRIVNKIEELFTNLDKGIESLEEVKYKLKIYRQAILKYAMEGKLTEKWREENKDKVEINMPSKKETPNFIFNLFELFGIPKEWSWAIINDITEFIQYGTSEKSSSSQDGLPVIRMGNLKEGEINFDNLKYFPIDWPEKEKYILEEGDLLFNRTNSLELVGKTAVYKSKFIPSVFASYLIRLKINLVYGSPEFISFYINSIYGRKYILSVASQQVGQANVNSKKLVQMPLPLPPLKEQHKIVERIEQLFSLADYIEETVDSKLVQSKTLRQSILKKAFEGKLVPQDPNDEPAEILLERIKMEKPNKEKLVQEKLI